MLRTTFASPFAHSPARSARQILSLPCSSLLVSVVDVVDLHLFRARLPTRIPRRRAKAFAPSSRRAMVSWATARALVLVTAVKLLLVPAYKSTDFEVHRNWLAITSQLPPSRWYLDATSRWTLDYPPFFAWFARGLAFLAPLADPGMLTLQAEPYDTPATTLFMRCTVIVSDALLALGALWITSPDRRPTFARARSSRRHPPRAPPPPRRLQPRSSDDRPRALSVQRRGVGRVAVRARRHLARRPRDGRVHLLRPRPLQARSRVRRPRDRRPPPRAPRRRALERRDAFSSRATRRRGSMREVPRRRRPRHRRLPRSFRPRGRPRRGLLAALSPSAADSRTRTGPRTSGRCTTRRIR